MTIASPISEPLHWNACKGELAIGCLDKQRPWAPIRRIGARGCATYLFERIRSMSPGFQVLSSAVSVGPYSLMIAK